ncbi:MAG: gamma-glutamyltransferase [Planctomycetaceae bacterium]
MYWDSKSKQLYGLNASGRGPYALTRELLQQKELTLIPTAGSAVMVVPGCVDGWDELRQRFGTMEFSQLLAPAIKYAEEGFPVQRTHLLYSSRQPPRSLNIQIPPRLISSMDRVPGSASCSKSSPR